MLRHGVGRFLVGHYVHWHCGAPAQPAWAAGKGQCSGLARTASCRVRSRSASGVLNLKVTLRNGPVEEIVHDPTGVHTHLFLAKKMARQTTTTATASYCLPTTLLLHYHYCYLLRLLLTDVPLLLSTSDFCLCEVRLGALTPVRKYKYKTCILNKRAH